MLFIYSFKIFVYLVWGIGNSSQILIDILEAIDKKLYL